MQSYATSANARRWHFESKAALDHYRRQKYDTLQLTTLATHERLDADAHHHRRNDHRALRRLLAALKKPSKRLDTTAHYLLHRAHLELTTYAEEPRELLAAVVFLAAKVEDEAVSLDDLLPTHADASHQAILQLEQRLLDALRFQVVVRSPRRALAGLIDAYCDATAVAPAQAARLRADADGFLAECLCCDAPLLFSPQQMALAALLANSATDKLAGWLEAQLGSVDGSVRARLGGVRELVARAQAADEVKPDGGREALDARRGERQRATQARRVSLERAREKEAEGRSRKRQSFEGEEVSRMDSVVGLASESVVSEGVTSGAFTLHKRKRDSS